MLITLSAALRRACGERPLSDRVEASLKKTLALRWERMIPAIRVRMGVSEHARTWKSRSPSMTDLAAEVKKASDAGKCFDPATSTTAAASERSRQEKIRGPAAKPGFSISDASA